MHSFIQSGFGRQSGNADSASAMRGGLRGREGPMGLGGSRIDPMGGRGMDRTGGSRMDSLGGGRMDGFRGRTEGWQRGDVSSRQSSRMELSGGGRSQGGIGGSGIGPLSLVAGAKKLFQDVSGIRRGPISTELPRFPHNASGLTWPWQDMLYLMIVQRPTEGEMAVAMERIASEGQGYY